MQRPGFMETEPAVPVLQLPFQFFRSTSTIPHARFSPGRSADVDGVIIGLNDCLVKRMGSDAGRGWYQGINTAAQDAVSYLHPCLVCGAFVMCIHLSVRK